MIEFTESELIDILFYLGFAQGDLEGGLGIDPDHDRELMEEWDRIQSIKIKIRNILKV